MGRKDSEQRLELRLRDKYRLIYIRKQHNLHTKQLLLVAEQQISRTSLAMLSLISNPSEISSNRLLFTIFWFSALSLSSTGTGFTGSTGQKYSENGTRRGSWGYAVFCDGRSARGDALDISSPSFVQHLLRLTRVDVVTFRGNFGFEL